MVIMSTVIVIQNTRMDEFTKTISTSVFSATNKGASLKSTADFKKLKKKSWNCAKNIYKEQENKKTQE